MTFDQFRARVLAALVAAYGTRLADKPSFFPDTMGWFVYFTIDTTNYHGRFVARSDSVFEEWLTSLLSH